LWALAGQALDTAPEASAPRLYVEILNEMFEAQTTHVDGLTNRVPTAVLVLEVVLAAIALAVLAVQLANAGPRRTRGADRGCARRPPGDHL
jgi:hypothetical protein